MLPYLEARLRGQISRWPQAQDWLALQAVDNQENLEKTLQSQAFLSILPQAAWLTLPSATTFLLSEQSLAWQWQNAWQKQVANCFKSLLVPARLWSSPSPTFWQPRQAQLLTWADLFTENKNIDESCKKDFYKQWLYLWSEAAASRALFTLWWPYWTGGIQMTQWIDFERSFPEILQKALRVMHVSSGKPLFVLAYFVALSLLFYRLRGQILPVLAFAALPAVNSALTAR